MVKRRRARADGMDFTELKFRHSWRPYQKRVLDAMNHHLSDQRLHVVAAPGAGKTVLGLETFRRLGKRTFILAPTRIIRDQWLLRLKDFCETDDPLSLDWVSNRLDAPGVLTSITYQALHAKSRTEEAGSEEPAEEPSERVDAAFVIETFKQHQVKVIILDEAHHLRAEWWKVLDQVCREIPDLVLVALTATPPYDSQGKEWRRYEELCGPIDEEISVPELIKAKTLCPHQDYIWAVEVSPTERQRIKAYDTQVRKLLQHLIEDDAFCSATFAHPWLDDTPDLKEIYADPKAALALLVFLKHKTGEGSAALCDVLDLSVKEIPGLTRGWWQTLLEHLLFDKSVKWNEEAVAYFSELKKRLRSLELLRKNELSILRSRRLSRSLALSGHKVDGCRSIHKLELKQRGDALRQVILTDYIRDEALNAADALGTTTLGAWPVFRELCSVSPVADSIALLTGRLSILHESLAAPLRQSEAGEKLSCEPFVPLPGYVKVGGPLNLLTNAFTALLISGDIKTLVGTGALLGEGWDAPVVNSLILASSVGTYMLTNQMRGRAIRLDHAHPDKVSSIWHLVALDLKSQSGYSDLNDLSRRFDTFVGLSESDLTIESGFKRMNATGFDTLQYGMQNVACFANNRQMLRRYLRINEVAGRWKAALAVDARARVIPSVETDPLPQLRQFHLRHTLGHLIYRLLTVLSSFFCWSAVLARHRLSVFFACLGIASVWMLCTRLKETFMALRIGLRYLPVDGALRQIGKALCRSLCEAGLIETGFRRLHVRSVQAADHTYYLCLSGGTYYESSLFADSLAELLGPIDNPRYLVMREGTFLGFRRADYHAVPARLAVKKELAEIFYRNWARYVGPSDLIYTRSKEGRTELLHAKTHTFTHAFREETRRLDRWQA
ncbi:DEAD/DEAH box helicase family protein [Pontiella agarivorans]|uniref:DEAD/DEAH box helicase family protein n=1 Tax=Pontiella agarivorans TaxID=3038953 RepID=A0ABU5MWY5_9BACT|nr:DEAD/DEAH box helicase family protein [Pontiella agarivorans]MDZ8118694.1 DEAD/DEAH box helicase family protein [Pontiella agarivorans]